MDSEKIAKELGRLVKGDVCSDIYTRIAFSTDASIYRIMPECVVFVKDSLDVQAAVKYAAESKTPVVARGAGSGVAGESLSAGIVLDFTKYMKSVVSISDDHSRVTVEPGLVLDELNGFLLKYGKKIGPDPSSGNRAVVGGVVSNNATGSHSLEYGHIAGHVESIEAVTADGEIVEFTNGQEADANQFARKCYELLSDNKEVIESRVPATKRNRSGYNIAGICRDGKINMAKLLSGSESTLAMFTQITLRTVDLPKAKGLLQLEFETIDEMAKAVAVIADDGASACELMDEKLLGIARESLPQYSDIFPEKAAAVLLVEHTGDDRGAVEDKIKGTLDKVGQLVKAGREFFDPQMQGRLWKSRKDAVPLLFRDKSKKRPVPFIEDVSVDNSKLAEYIKGLNEILAKYDCPCAYYGHAGDGELHIRPFLDLHDSGDVEKMQAVANEVFELAWSLGGSISGEHADGLVRAAFVKRQYGSEYYEVLRGVKAIFDPEGIMNPGKILNDDPDVMVKNVKLARVVNGSKSGMNLNMSHDEYLLEIEQCNGDGVCRSANGRMCPVFKAMGTELACSRAKANLLHAWVTGLLEDEEFESEEFKRVLGYCVNCKMCSVQCPSGVDISKLIVEARSEYVKRKGLTRTEFALINNRFMSMMGSGFSPVSNFVLKLGPAKWGLEKFLGLDRRRGLPAFEKGSFLRKARKYIQSQPAIEKPVDKVVYFVDSYANYNDHELGFAVLKTLRHNDIEVALPDQRPAPMPGVVYGDVKTARKDFEFIVKNLIGYVKDGYKVICSEPSGALCLCEDLPLFVNGDDARAVSENTYEYTDYLNVLESQGKLKPVENKIDESFVYHRPCHLWAMGKNDNLDLLKKTGISLDRPETGCCGLAGTCGMQKKHYDLSMEIGREMAEVINNSYAEFVMTQCGACKMQIEHLTGKKVQHPAKILARAYNLL